MPLMLFLGKTIQRPTSLMKEMVGSDMMSPGKMTTMLTKETVGSDMMSPGKMMTSLTKETVGLKMVMSTSLTKETVLEIEFGKMPMLKKDMLGMEFGKTPMSDTLGMNMVTPGKMPTSLKQLIIVEVIQILPSFEEYLCETI